MTKLPNVADGRYDPENQDCATDQSPKQKWNDRVERIHFGHSGSGKKDGIRQGCHGVEKNKEPTVPTLFDELLRQ